MPDGFIFLLKEMFSYTFLVRAFLVGALVSICAALLGVSLVLKRYSMIGDGLSHVGFGALALATALNAAPLAVSIPVVITAAFLLLRLGGNSLIKGDAAIALVSTGSLALGVVLISRTTGMNTDVCNYLFGSILAMSKSDVYLSAALSVTVLVLFALCYHKLFAITFDETFARTAGVKTGVYNMLIALLTALTIVLGMRMMGAMLISALIIFPALTSMRLFKRFRDVTLCAAGVSIICFFAGIIISYVYATPTGASVVLIHLVFFAVFWLAGTVKKARSGVKKTGALAAASVILLVSSCGGGRTAAFTYARAQENARAGVAEASSGAAEASPGNAGAAARETAPFPGETDRRSGAETSGEIVEIREKMFLAQTNDVYLNRDEYLGRTLKLEGLFKREHYDGRNYCFVIRYGPGCCGNDGNAGFEVAWEPRHRTLVNYPEIDAWVAATGVLTLYEEDEVSYLYLALRELTVLDRRGAEFVAQ